MIYLLALIGLVTLGVLFWRTFGPDADSAPEARTIGPDDDPEFLRRIDPGAARGPAGDNEEGGPTPV